MKFKSLVGAAALAAVAFGAHADDQVVHLDPNAVTSFTAKGTVLAGGDDVISLADLVVGQKYDIDVTVSSQGIKWDQKHTNLNGVTGSYSGKGFKFIDILYTGVNPFTLTLVGTKTGSVFGYSGDVSATAVPEPETYGMMLGGLAVLGMVARRKARKAA